MRLVVPRLTDLSYKAIATSWDSLDKLHSTRTFTERLSEKRNVLSEVTFFDKGTRPDSLHEVVFSNDLATLFDQRDEYVEDLGRQRDRFAFAQEYTFRRF